MNVLVKYENDRILPYLYRNWLNRLDDNEKETINPMATAASKQNGHLNSD